jgi:predicted TIM-barrel fold metal-dependent hydrolase
VSRSAEIRSQLDHPVIDADGHWIEPAPLFMDALRDAGGPGAVEQFVLAQHHRSDWYRMTEEERLTKRPMRTAWWALPGNTLDRATALLPQLLYERLEEFGLDFAILYPTLGLTGTRIQDPDFRRAFVRATNELAASSFSPFSDRLAPAAVIPTFTPAEAIEELRYAVGTLGFKVAFVSGTLVRPLPGSEPSGDAVSDRPHFIDSLVLDSLYDYDPLWEEFSRLKVAVTSHAGSMGWADRRSPSNFSFNHVGHFAQSNHLFAKALLFAGVTERFPDLHFAFLEGGAGWAVNLYTDLFAHLNTRALSSMVEHARPSNISLEELSALCVRYDDRLSGRLVEIAASVDSILPGLSLETLTEREEPFDDFAASGIKAPDDLRARFVENFFFGCEADDPMTMLPYDPRLRAPLKALFSSDIGHFDVIDMNRVLEEAYELVEDGHIDEAAFRKFTFSNSVELHAGMNDQFFSGTAIEDAVDREFVPAVSSAVQVG